MGVKTKPKNVMVALPPTPLPAGTESLLGRKEVAQAIGISVGMFKKLLASGEYPAPDTRIGPFPRWRVSTHNAWIDGKCSKGSQ